MSIFAIDNVSINRAPALTADFDRDRVVNAADLLQWQGDFGQTTHSDADGDGDSDGADFLAWQRQLGSAATVAVTSTVPEPSNVLLLALGSLELLFRRRTVP